MLNNCAIAYQFVDECCWFCLERISSRFTYKTEHRYFISFHFTTIQFVVFIYLIFFLAFLKWTMNFYVTEATN